LRFLQFLNKFFNENVCKEQSEGYGASNDISWRIIIFNRKIRL
jgi:hypothetical protein